jgi:hypothetical protein
MKEPAERVQIKYVGRLRPGEANQDSGLRDSGMTTSFQTDLRVYKRKSPKKQGMRRSEMEEEEE